MEKEKVNILFNILWVEKKQRIEKDEIAKQKCSEYTLGASNQPEIIFAYIWI